MEWNPIVREYLARKMGIATDPTQPLTDEEQMGAANTQDKLASIQSGLGQQFTRAADLMSGSKQPTPATPMAQPSAMDLQKQLEGIREHKRENEVKKNQELLNQFKALQDQKEKAGQLKRETDRDTEAARHNAAMEAKAGDPYTHVTTPDGSVYSEDKRTGEIKKVVAGTPGGKPVSANKTEDEWNKLTDSVSTFHGRANLNRENQVRLQNAERLEALVLGPNGDIANLTPQQTREAGTSLANLISSGSMSLSQIEELTPHTMASQFANLKQKFLNEPQGADAQAFLQNMLDTAAREKKTIKRQVLRGQLQSLGNFAHLKKADAARFAAILKGAGVDPARVQDDGLPTSDYEAEMTGPTPAQGASKPTTVIQNGHTYTLNPKTGEYE